MKGWANVGWSGGGKVVGLDAGGNLSNEAGRLVGFTAGIRLDNPEETASAMLSRSARPLCLMQLFPGDCVVRMFVWREWEAEGLSGDLSTPVEIYT